MSIFEADELRRPVLEIRINRIEERKGKKSDYQYPTKESGCKGEYQYLPAQQEHEIEVLKLRLPADDYDVTSILEAILGCQP